MHAKGGLQPVNHHNQLLSAFRGEMECMKYQQEMHTGQNSAAVFCWMQQSFILLNSLHRFQYGVYPDALFALRTS